MALDAISGILQDVDFHPLDLDLQKVKARKINRINRPYLYFGWPGWVLNH